MLEAYFRYVYDESDGLGFLNTNTRWQQRHVVTNNYFYRDRNFNTEKETGVIRIGVLGDSITFGGGIEKPEDRFSNLLESKLKGTSYKVEVYNLGKSGTDTETQIKDFEKVKHLNFDIIVWQYFLNDIQPEEKSTGTPIIDKNSQQAKVVKFMSDRSFLFDFLYWRYSSRYKQTFEELKNADLNQYQKVEVFENHKKEMKSFLDEFKKEKKEVVVIIFPFTHLLGPNYPAQNVHDELKSFFAQNKITTIDLREDLEGQNPQTLVASKFDSHPNEAVHAIAAQKLFEAVEAILNAKTTSFQLDQGTSKQPRLPK
ncbi:MAG: SGNH/GDSL hydrolase family protein [Candidatus Curtissbacteria bacterium]|nr:SGNH/GDSL hydrolase family protein [Candidatus Curtissbacteria bacterium]